MTGSGRADQDMQPQMADLLRELRAQRRSRRQSMAADVEEAAASGRPVRTVSLNVPTGQDAISSDDEEREVPYGRLPRRRTAGGGDTDGPGSGPQPAVKTVAFRCGRPSGSGDGRRRRTGRSQRPTSTLTSGNDQKKVTVHVTDIVNGSRSIKTLSIAYSSAVASLNSRVMTEDITRLSGKKEKLTQMKAKMVEKRLHTLRTRRQSAELKCKELCESDGEQAPPGDQRTGGACTRQDRIRARSAGLPQYAKGLYLSRKSSSSFKVTY